MNKLLFYIKWVLFLFYFIIRNNWLLHTKEGGKYLKNKLLSLGIIGIKFGQYLYTRPTRELSIEVKEILESLLSTNIIHSKEETTIMMSHDKNDFSNSIHKIEEKCIGSGSLAQVHICYLNDDIRKKYVLKVAHPCIFKLEEEVKYLKNILHIASYFKNINVDWDTFFTNITIQTDLNIEAENTKKFHNIYKDYEKIEIPQIIYSNKYFIVMSYCEGIPMNRIFNQSKEYILATNLISSCFFHTTYKYGFCHGDLHYGNILVKPNGHISLIDFGICNYNLNKEMHYKNNILYIYREFILEKNIHSVNKLLENLIVIPNNVASNYISKLTIKFISFYYNYTNKHEKIKNDTYALNLISDFCSFYNLCINGEAIYFIIQMTILEQFSYNNGNNGMITLRSAWYMKTNSFFMNEMSDFILNLYNLEYKHENELVKLKYHKENNKNVIQNKNGTWYNSED